MVLEFQFIHIALKRVNIETDWIKEYQFDGKITVDFEDILSYDKYRVMKTSDLMKVKTGDFGSADYEFVIKENRDLVKIKQVRYSEGKKRHQLLVEVRLIKQ